MPDAIHRRRFAGGLLLGILLFTAAAWGQSTAPSTEPVLAAAASTAPSTVSPPQRIDLKYSFGPQNIPGYQQVTPRDAYTPDRGYGFDLDSKVEVIGAFGDNAPPSGGFVRGREGQPFFFSARLPIGAYQVTVVLGGGSAESITTVKSESRRLMLQAIHTAPGATTTRTFLVHLRVPRLPDGSMVRLKPRERDAILEVKWPDRPVVKFTELDWDEKLTLEFSDAAPQVSSIEITNAANPVTVFIAGDSTVSDWAWEPWNSWGQMLPRWFKPPVLIANFAEPGETTASFVGERRWPLLMSVIQPGDYVLMQFGHNDLGGVPLPRFRQYFLDFIKETRSHGATPVLVTPMNRKTLDASGKVRPSLGAYPQAIRQVAREQGTALIDLNAMSVPLYEAMTADELKRAFVDSTHFTDYGSYELAKCVVHGIIEARLPITAKLVEDWKPFDPAHPDHIGDFHLPVDPQTDPMPIATRPSSRAVSRPAGT